MCYCNHKASRNPFQPTQSKIREGKKFTKQEMWEIVVAKDYKKYYTSTITS